MGKYENDSISSVMAPYGYGVELWEHHGFKGKHIHVEGKPWSDST